jgi:hypothetical protein
MPAAPEEVAATRADCLERYRDKKRRRLVHKTIRYHKRKVNADKRLDLPAFLLSHMSWNADLRIERSAEFRNLGGGGDSGHTVHDCPAVPQNSFRHNPAFLAARNFLHLMPFLEPVSRQLKSLRGGLSSEKLFAVHKLLVLQATHQRQICQVHG